MRQRSCQTALRVARVPRGIRAMPAKEKPRVSRGDDFLCAGLPKYRAFYAKVSYKTRNPLKLKLKSEKVLAAVSSQTPFLPIKGVFVLSG